MPDSEVVELIAEVGRRLRAQQDDIVAALSETMFNEIADLADDDPQMVSLLQASVDGNVSTILHILINDIPLDHVQPTTAAVEYAVRLAQRGIAAHPLRRAYHVGQHDLINLCFLEVQGLSSTAETRVQVLHRITLVIGAYIDWITQFVLEAYDQERERRISASGNMLSALVNRVLDPESAAASEFLIETGYELDQHHIGAVVWLPDDSDDSVMGLERLVQQVGVIARSSPIFVAVDRSLAWAWFARGSRAAMPDLAGVRELAAQAHGRIAVGLVQQGIEGFRDTHRQALAAYRLARLADRDELTSYGDPGVAAVSMLGRDVEGTRSWVLTVLGPLAEATEAAARSRETLRTFLATSGSYTESAKILNLHRNSVKYRVDKVLEDRGGPLGEERVDVELALQVCAFLGDSGLS
ncbi:MAG: helix-turn-helix domain-containing protein [Nocardioides sp.]|nr:helix-turn-helix domain-containing protein [Nocardioides sp.]